MFSFRGQKPVTGSRQQPDSFAEALADLDDIPLAYHQSGRNTRLSTTSTECNTPSDARSEISTHFQSHPAVGWDRATSGSTLKAYDESEPPKHDAEEATVPPPAPPVAVGFWDKSLRGTRKRVFLKYSRTCEYYLITAATSRLTT